MTTKIETPTIEGVVEGDHYTGRPSRLLVMHKGIPHDCAIDAVVSLALEQAGITLALGQRLRVTVEVLD